MLSGEIVQDDLNWLRYNMQPWVTVLHKWKNTAAHRVHVLQAGTKILKDFKLYADPKADNLVFIYIVPTS